MSSFSQLKAFATSFKTVEIVLLFVFILYLVIPIPFPIQFHQLIDSALGMIFLFLITVALFLYFNPLLGLVYIAVAYELLRRASVAILSSTAVPIITYPAGALQGEMSHQQSIPAEDKLLKGTTLEEEIVSTTVKPASSEYISSSFKPTATKVEGSLYI